MVKKLRKKCDVWKEQGCQGFEESSDEEDEEFVQPHIDGRKKL